MRAKNRLPFKVQGTNLARLSAHTFSFCLCHLHFSFSLCAKCMHHQLRISRFSIRSSFIYLIRFVLLNLSCFFFCCPKLRPALSFSLWGFSKAGVTFHPTPLSSASVSFCGRVEAFLHPQHNSLCLCMCAHPYLLLQSQVEFYNNWWFKRYLGLKPMKLKILVHVC